MDHFDILAVTGYLLTLWAAYRGMDRLLREKEVLFGGVELLLFALFTILFWLKIFVPGFWQ